MSWGTPVPIWGTPEGGNQDPPIVFEQEGRPEAPRNVSVEIIVPGTFRVRWSDARIIAPPQFTASRIVERWRVVICSTERAGNPSGGDQFAQRVLNLGIGIREQQAGATGRTLEYIHTDPHLGDVWLIVVGISFTGVIGVPSSPVLVRLEGPSTGIPDEIPDATIDWACKTVNGYDVIELSPLYQSPVDMFNFFGMHLYAENYFGASEITELDCMSIFHSQTGLAWSTPWLLHLAQPVFATGTATFTSTSTTVNRISGNYIFTAGMVGRPIFAKNFALGDGTWVEHLVGGFIDFNTLTLSVPWAGTTGTYTYSVLNQTTFYFVAINRDGGRSATPLVGSPSVVL